VRGKEVPASSLNLLEIMKEVNNRDLDFEKVTAKVSKDVSITYKLLRYINSAYFKRVQEITSIKKALIFLGQDEIRRFMSVILMSNLATSKTPELAITSCVRGRFFELLGELDHKGDIQDLFTLGLFSLIDAILDQPMEKIMKDLPLSDSIVDALVYNKGDLVIYLDLIKTLEKGDWKELDNMTRKMNLDTTHLPSLYKEALEWADAIRSL
jgi:EAL and modified HD-GYP domain-containing signal transduction protein